MSFAVTEDIASELLEVESEIALSATLARASRRLGFDHYALSLDSRSGKMQSPGVLLHDYPDEWAKVYVA